MIHVATRSNPRSCCIQTGSVYTVYAVQNSFSGDQGKYFSANKENIFLQTRKFESVNYSHNLSVKKRYLSLLGPEVFRSQESSSMRTVKFFQESEIYSVQRLILTGINTSEYWCFPGKLVLSRFFIHKTKNESTSIGHWCSKSK